MSHEAFYLVKRHDRLTDGKPAYYVRFRDETGDLLPWRSTGHTAKTRAELWVLEQFKNNSIATGGNLTFGRNAESWRKWDECAYIRGRLARGRRISHRCADNQRHNLEWHILPAFKDKLIAKISPRMIESWVMALAERNDLSPVTCNHILATLKVMLSEAHRLGVIPSKLPRRSSRCKRARRSERSSPSKSSTSSSTKTVSLTSGTAARHATP